MREPPPRLGRGLAALLGPALVDTSNSSVADVSTDFLEPNPFQPRESIEPSELEELTASIQASGLLQPLLVRPHPTTPGRYQIIAGERRWRAARAAGLTTVPCLVRSLKDGETAAAALVENLQRKDLNAMEEAEGYRRLGADFGLTQVELGTAVGKSRSHVANMLRLLNLPEAVTRHVRSGALTAGHARAALACADPAAAAAAMIAGDLTVRQAENLRHRSDSPTQEVRKAPSARDPDHAAVEADLAERLGLRVEITVNGSKGVVRLRYQTLEQLDYIVARLSGP